MWNRRGKKMNYLLIKPLIKTEQIKNIFSLYFWMYYDKDIEDTWRWRSSQESIPIIVKTIKHTKNGKLYESSKIKSFGIINKYLFKIQQDNNILNNHLYNVQEVYLEINKLISTTQLPKKYTPKIIKIEKAFKPYFKNIINLDTNKKIFSWIMYRIDFDEHIISYLMQKHQSNSRIQKFTKLLLNLSEKSEGKNFDEYIDDWTKEIMKKYVL